MSQPNREAEIAAAREQYELEKAAYPKTDFPEFEDWLAENYS